MSHGCVNGVIPDPGVDVKVVPQVKNVGHGTGAGNGEVAPSAQVQSFEGPEKVLEVWFKPPLKLVKSGLSLSKECEEQATNSSGAGACKAKAIVCPGSNGYHGSSENGNDVNGNGASSHNVPEGVPDGKSFGKPDGLPVPINGGPQGTPDGRCGKPDGLGGAQQADGNGNCKCNGSSSSSSKLEEKGLDGSTIKREGLRTVPRKEWEVLLDLVHCQILSITSNAYMDAFVLSESSLFVYPHRIVLKTCGTTTLLKCVQKLLEVGKSVGLTEVEDVFYCRKNFLYPENQLFPHSSFKDECDFLDQHFQGSGYQLGKTNGDHWFLYVTDQSASVETTGQPDQTLEVLMSGLDPEHMKQLFYKNKDFVSARETTKKSGIGDLFPGAIIDDYMFDPCGYSMNGLIGDSYFTIHVTPQPQCSYASFETNASYKDYTELIKKVVNVFKPTNFFVTLFANIYTAPALDSSFPAEILGCKKAAKMLCEFNNSYRLSFAQYVADPKTRALSKSPVRTPRRSPNDS